ncbi:hypothetical protein CF137_00355 [Aeromonas sobria]|nr:hypothetical protein CF137_00355 [Aeromonas sobria]
MDKSETENEEESETKSETKSWKERLKRESEQKNAVDFCYPSPFLASHAPLTLLPSIPAKYPGKTATP